jgi:hypothetical protein
LFKIRASCPYLFSLRFFALFHVNEPFSSEFSLTMALIAVLKKVRHPVSGARATNGTEETEAGKATSPSKDLSGI